MVLSSRVIVGRPSRKTPLIRSALSSVVLNSPWNVPSSLVRQDILPKTLRDPGYLPRNDFTILLDQSSDAAVIDPANIDWNMVTPNHFPYRLQQAPGPKNSLGRYKFNMPSSNAIYLHDTPNHNLFGQDQRARSVGCVLVNKGGAGEHAAAQCWLGQRSRQCDHKAGHNTIYVLICYQIPVNLFYLAVWVTDNCKPQFLMCQSKRLLFEQYTTVHLFINSAEWLLCPWIILIIYAVNYWCLEQLPPGWRCFPTPLSPRSPRPDPHAHAYHE